TSCRRGCLGSPCAPALCGGCAARSLSPAPCGRTGACAPRAPSRRETAHRGARRSSGALAEADAPLGGLVAHGARRALEVARDARAGVAACETAQCAQLLGGPTGSLLLATWRH